MDTKEYLRKFNGLRYIAAFFISLAIFLSGFALSSLLSQSKLKTLQQSIDALQSEYSSLEMLTLIDKTASVSCDMYEEQIVNFANETDDFGQKLEFIAGRLSPTNQEVINMKTNYWLMEIRDFFTLKQIEAKCGKKYKTVLYFYDQECKDCSYQGELLRQIKSDYPEVMIYSFDATNKKVSLIKILSQIYNIKTSPTLIIGDKRIEKVSTRAELDKVLKLGPVKVIKPTTPSTTPTDKPTGLWLSI